MKRIHLPSVDMRYWAAILLASVFGTNTGDLYAHDSGLGLWRGLAVLAALAATGFVLERRDERPREWWYWAVILIIRTGATNIADYLAFRVRVPAVALGLGLMLLLLALAWGTHRAVAASDGTTRRLPDAGAAYWAAMLTAGVLGTVIGDDTSHLVGQGPASLLLGGALGAILLMTRGEVRRIGTYWATVAVARTAGTAMGDFLAENRGLSIGLPLATLITGTVFMGVLLLWPRRRTHVDPA